MPQSTERYYVRDYVRGQPRQIWLVDDRTATQMGVTNPEAGAGTYFRAEPSEGIWDCIRRKTPWLEPGVTEGLFHLMSLGPGEFYPRIARPLALAREPRLWSPSFLAETSFVANARSQLALLTRKLETICQTVQPSEETLEVYGHEIRNLLILAATEAEMHWRGVLIANGAAASRFSSNEYVKLIEPLRLRDYTIAFHDFPDVQPFRPFAGWSNQDPTRSLGWYEAYHGVKHNREGEFARGTLRRAFEAVSACIALLIAQFGFQALSAELSGLVGLTVPDWPIVEMYLPSMTTNGETPVMHPGL